MSLAPRIFSTLLLLSLIPAGAANAVCENGMKETLIAPAELEYGKINYQMFSRPAVHVERGFPAVSKVMTEAEYKLLPKIGTYLHQQSWPEKIESTVIDLPMGDIAQFDYVYWPDGTVATRKIEKLYERTVMSEEILEPARQKSAEKKFTRPEPIELPNGRLKVVMSPHYLEPWTVPGRVHDVERKYVKSRTPAKYQLSFCEE